MLHFSCDVCGKDMTPGGAGRFVVRLEAYPADASAGLTDADLDPDHVEEVARLLAEQEEGGVAPPPARLKQRFDLCPDCYGKFAADPLGREKLEFDFSPN